MELINEQYVHYDWCNLHNIWTNPKAKDLAINILRHIGVKNVFADSSKEVVCASLQHNVIRLVSNTDCKNTEEVALLHDGSTQCLPLKSVLDMVASDPNYNAKFSKLDVAKMVHIYTLMKSGTSPCDMFQEQGEYCNQLGDRCSYHVNQLHRMVFRHGEQGIQSLQQKCTINQSKLSQIIKSNYPVQEYISLTYDAMVEDLDVHFGQHQTPILSKNSVYEGYLQSLDWFRFRQQLWENIQNIDVEELKNILTYYHLSHTETSVHQASVARNIVGTKIVNILYPEIQHFKMNMLIDMLNEETVKSSSATMKYILSVCVVVQHRKYMTWVFKYILSYMDQQVFVNAIVNPIVVGTLLAFMWVTGIDTNIVFGPLLSIIQENLKILGPEFILPTLKRNLGQDSIDSLGADHVFYWKKVGHYFSKTIMKFTTNNGEIIVGNWPFVASNGVMSQGPVLNNIVGPMLSQYANHLYMMGLSTSVFADLQARANVILNYNYLAHPKPEDMFRDSLTV
jgi:hypothetical protein